MKNLQAWEWEEGDGFTVVGTHNREKAYWRIYDLLKDSIPEDPDFIEQTMDSLEGAVFKKQWIPKEVLNGGLWINTFDYWWFGRAKIIMVMV